MKTKITNLQASHEKGVHNQTLIAAAKAAKRVCELYPHIKLVQPNITSIESGMGSWSFNGKGIAYSTEEECKGDLVEIEDVRIYDVVKLRGLSDWYSLPINNELVEVVELMDFITEVNQLNCSTWQHGFNESGVMFLYSNSSNQNNPFATPNKKYWEEGDYYKRLKKIGAPIVFINDDLIKPK